MNRIAWGVLVLLLAWPPLRGEDKPSSLRQQLDALVKESQQAHQDLDQAAYVAKTDEEVKKAFKEYEAKARRIAAGLLAIAEKAPKDAAAIDALSKVFDLQGCAQEKKKVVALLLRDYLQSGKVAPICKSLVETIDDDTEKALRTILAKNPHKSVQAEASFALAQMLSQRFYIAKNIQQNPDFAEWVGMFSGKEVAAELLRQDLDALELASGKVWSAFAETYSADIPSGRLTSACFQLIMQEAAAVAPALRTLEQDKRRAIRGIACLTLGQVLKQRADTLAEKDAKAAAQLRDESAQALRRATEKYGDVEIQFGERAFGGNIGEKSKKELYEVLHLSIGMRAPEIESEDQDGKQFKLSDYKGKVVLLDFWSQY
jgi:hypothetical protein